jgi:hypothetical protein
MASGGCHVGRGIGFTIAASSRGRQSHAITRLEHMTPQLGRQSRLPCRPRIEHEGGPTSGTSSLESPRRHLRPLQRGEELRLVIEDLDRPPDATPPAEPTPAQSLDRFRQRFTRCSPRFPPPAHGPALRRQGLRRSPRQSAGTFENASRRPRAGGHSTNRDTIMEVIMPVTRQKTSAEWIKLLNDAGVPCGPIYKINESFADPQVQHLAMAQPVHSPALGDLTILGHPVSHGEKRLPLRSAAPELGDANEEVLGALGYTKEQIADLSKRGVV